MVLLTMYKIYIFMQKKLHYSTYRHEPHDVIIGRMFRPPCRNGTPTDTLTVTDMPSMSMTLGRLCDARGVF